MSTLYLTDLDGTFLGDNAVISDRSREIINYLIDNNVNFTIATARTYATVVPMFERINLKLPVVLMNGVCIYDPVKKRPIEYTGLTDDRARKIFQVFERFDKSPLVYFENGDRLLVEYKRLENDAVREYLTLRSNFYHKSFRQVENYELNGRRLLFAVYLGRPQDTSALFEELCGIDGVCCNFYPDNYSGYYFLEAYSVEASKLLGARRVQQLTGCDKIVAFGDNMNDLPLICGADEAYAVENAAMEVKRHATGIIGPNTENAVAEFLLARFESGKSD